MIKTSNFCEATYNLCCDTEQKKWKNPVEIVNEIIKKIEKDIQKAITNKAELRNTISLEETYGISTTEEEFLLVTEELAKEKYY